LAKIAGMIDEKVISVALAAEFPIEQLQKALEAFAAGGVRGKISIVIED
jgi:NADPH:quinone reductase-like Zn-dependent oxidoreductase